MTLSEILQRLHTFDEEATIIAAEPWTPMSAARVIGSPEDGLLSGFSRDGMSYFLEVSIARELQEGRPAGQNDEAFCRRLIEWTISDA